MNVSDHRDQRKGKGDWKIAVYCLGFVSTMVGMSYAAVPLYQLFCQVTGYGGTTARVEQASDVILDQTIKIRFDANVSNALPWEFKPEIREIEIAIGETAQMDYLATNLFQSATHGTATFNVTPQAAGAYFNKIECFCFTETELKPGETINMPVVFFVDPDIVNYEETKNIGTITLSYTFFPDKDKDETPVAANIVPMDGNLQNKDFSGKRSLRGNSNG